ncbi:hypothetical protein CY34DRAFT_711225 [Suillus luteus UH-Slu-Lm8-n1]|uniref:Uncharacterized protein n=1 Tax=Suillus luteus UH-Slu-Lm8-n1 TaxID=930992 RepID=A0A0C9Z7F2_9AGAM|nr:hypothetical protein CY34DRAFT_711225 [Suillus luteus UH-Slu-Lm8-n1]
MIRFHNFSQAPSFPRVPLDRCLQQSSSPKLMPCCRNRFYQSHFAQLLTSILSRLAFTPFLYYYRSFQVHRHSFPSVGTPMISRRYRRRCTHLLESSRSRDWKLSQSIPLLEEILTQHHPRFRRPTCFF